MSTPQQPDLFAVEQLTLVRDARCGLRAAIAIDSTTLGPALGGVRYVRYPTLAAGVVEAQRLAAAMTLKNALAGLPYGGGKSVIFNEGQADRERLMTRFGEFVARLHGSYLPGVDMGTTGLDLAAMETGGAEVSCQTEDPAPWTARGVFEAISAAVRFRFAQSDLADLRVLVQGAGQVGARLATLCANAGARVSISDIDAARAQAVADSIDATVVSADSVMNTPSDIFAPCATARVIDAATASRIETSVVAGAANDTLDGDGVAAALAGHDITYVPDFIANAGGVIHIHALRAGWNRSQLTDAITGIGDRVADLLHSAAPGADLDAAARGRARRVIAAASTTG